MLTNRTVTLWPTKEAFKKIVEIFVIPDGVTEIAHFSFNDQHCLVWWCEALTVRLLVGGGRTLAY